MRPTPLILLTTLFLLACGDGFERECGFGTEAVGEECVTIASCGPGTTLRGGECTADEAGSLRCERGTLANDEGTECVLAADVCVAPAQLDSATGRCVAPTDIRCGTGTRLEGTVCVPSCPDPFRVQNADRTGCVDAARVQVFNALPGDAVSVVDIWAGSRFAEDEDGNVVGDDLAYGEATPVFEHPADELLVFSRPDAPPPVDPGFNATAEDFLAGESYFVVLTGVGPEGTYDRTVNPGGNLALSFALIPDPEDINAGGPPRLALVHAMSDLPPTGWGRQTQFGVAPPDAITTSLSYSSGRAYFDAPNVQTFDIYPTSGTPWPFFSYQLSTDAIAPDAGVFPPGGVACLVLHGFRAPQANPGDDGLVGPEAELSAITPDGTVYPLDEAGRVQVVNATLGATAGYDLLAPGAPFAVGLPQNAATSVASYGSRLDYAVTVRPSGGALDLVSATIRLEPGAHERWVLIGDEGGAPSLELARVRFDGDRTEDTARFAARGLHGAANIGSVDFQLSPLAAPTLGPPELPNLDFGESSSQSFNAAFADQRVVLTLAGSESPLASFDVTLTSDGFSGGDTLLFVIKGSFQPSGQNSQLLVVNQSGNAATYIPN